MTRSTLRHLSSLCCCVALLSACPGDPVEATSETDDSTDTGGSGAMTLSPTTAPTTAADTMADSTGQDGTADSDTNTTVEPDGTGDTDDDGTTTDDDGTTTDDGTTDGTSGTTDDGTTGTTGTAGTTGTTDPSTGSSEESSSSSTGTADPFDCEDTDLGSMLPHTEEGNNMGAGDDFVASCAISGANDEDVLYQWTAPADGVYVFDTIGSSLDTILTLLSACDGTEIACNDDLNGDVFQSAITLSMMEGESVLISVDGWNATGDFQLNIYEQPDGFGDCAMGSPIFDCLPEEVCLVDNQMAPTVGVCSEFGCSTAADCPPLPPGGTAIAACVDVTGDLVAEECIISCVGGATCPTGMNCFMSSICVWPAS